MQPRNDVSDSLAPHYGRKPSPNADLKPFPMPTRVFAVVLAWLIPGAGHLVLGKLGRGVLLMVLIVGSFYFGLLLNGKLYIPVAADPPSAFHFDPISILWSFAQIGSGLCYAVAHALGLGIVAKPESATYEYGNTFMFLAGLLNYLLILDVFDIAAGRRR